MIPLPPKIVLGLDVSSKNIGWALFSTEPPYYINSGVFIFDDKTDHLSGGRLYKTYQHIELLLESFPTITDCVLEDVIFKVGKYLGSTTTLSLLSMYKGAALVALQKHVHVKCKLQAPATTKKRLGVVKKHKEPKYDLHQKLKERVPILAYTMNLDELDACCLALSEVLS